MSDPLGGIGGFTGGSLQQIIALRQQILQRSQLLQQINAAKPIAEPQAASAGAAPGFADSLRSALDEVAAVQANAAEITAAYERGEVTDVAKVMLAREQSGVAFEATLQVRNRLLTAYQEIMRLGV